MTSASWWSSAPPPRSHPCENGERDRWPRPVPGGAHLRPRLPASVAPPARPLYVVADPGVRAPRAAERPPVGVSIGRRRRDRPRALARIHRGDEEGGARRG